MKTSEKREVVVTKEAVPGVGIATMIQSNPPAKARTTNGEAVLQVERKHVLRVDIRPDPNQPRKDFPEAAQAELRASIEANGIQECLLVRPDPEKKTAYMIVDGERRWRVCGEAKIERLPVEVQEMTDDEVQTYQRISGTKRLNLSALEEAGAAQRLFEQRQKANAKFSVADLGKELGRERSSMYELLRLNKLSQPVREALMAGKIDLSKAQLFGQVAPGLHAKLLKSATETQWDGSTMSVKALRELIQRDYSRQLSGAGWKWDDAGLVKAAGPCSTCPKRSGNIEGLEGNPNVCTDVSCFGGKQAAHTGRLMEQAKKDGKRIIPAETYLRQTHRYAESKDECYEDNKGRSYGTLAKAANIEPAFTLNREGQAVMVFTPEDTTAILKANKISHSPSGNGDWERQRKAAAKKKQLLRKADGVIRPKLIEAARKAKPTVKFWQWVVLCLVEYPGVDVLFRRGLMKMGQGYSTNFERKLIEGIKDENELRALVVDALASAEPEGYSSPDFAGSFTEACDLFKVDYKKPLAAVVEESKTKKPSVAKNAKNTEKKKGAKK